MLIDDERSWLRELLTERFTPGQVVEVVDGTGHRYDSFVLAGLAPAATITEIVRHASEQGWDLKLLERLIGYVETHFDGHARTEVLAGLGEIRDNILSRQGHMQALPHPFAACFVRNKLPFVNRPSLRKALEALREPDGPRILLLRERYTTEELDLALAGMRRNLAPGGLLMFDANTIHTYRGFFAEQIERARDLPAVHFTYHPDGIVQRFSSDEAKSGFAENPEIQSEILKPFVPGQEEEKCAHRVAPPIVRFFDSPSTKTLRIDGKVINGIISNCNDYSTFPFTERRALPQNTASALHFRREIPDHD